MTNERARTLLRISFGIVLLLVGVVVALLYDGATSPVGVLGKTLGLALIVAGIVSVFQEAVLSPLRTNEIRNGFDQIHGKLANGLDQIHGKLANGFDQIHGKLAGPGIAMIAAEREGFHGYHTWLLDTRRQEMFFAGHSVLHRIEADIHERRLTAIDEALWNKVREGSKVRLLLLDPTWSLVPDIATWEGQPPEKMLRDLATSLGICQRLWQKKPAEALPGSLEVRMSTELIQYAFHSVKCTEESAQEMLIGFYFAGRLGIRSPLFRIEDQRAQEAFQEHFTTAFNRAKLLLTYSPGGVRTFDQVHYKMCRNALGEHLEPAALAQLCPEA